jgi:hypothetical protein
MNIKLNTANPIDNNATMVCKTISLAGSFFMARSFPGSLKVDDHQTGIQTFRLECGARQTSAGRQ